MKTHKGQAYWFSPSRASGLVNRFRACLRFPQVFMSRLTSRRGSKVSDVFWHSEHFTRTRRESLNVQFFKTPACLDVRHVHWFKKKTAMKQEGREGRKEGRWEKIESSPALQWYPPKTWWMTVVALE